MANANQRKNCPSCGAPIVSEICAYCGMATGLKTAEADIEYPILECKEANINFWNIGFPLIFAMAFGFTGITMLLIALTAIKNATLFLVGLPFSLIGGGALFVVLRTITRYRKLKKRGKIIQATVYGYMDDNVLLNGSPAQIVKLLVPTSSGPRFIFYQLGDTIKRYGINDTVDILVYQNYFMICKNTEIYR